MSKKCSHEDARLKCADCGAPICGNCLVECPVGFRCKSCIRPQGSKLANASWVVVLRALGASALIGLFVGWLMPNFQIPYISAFIYFFLGIYGGRWLVNHIDHHRLGSRTTMTIVFGVLLGMSFSPLAQIPLLIVDILANHGQSIFGSLLNVLSVLFDPVCFFAGILRPTVWGDRW